ncbi:DnaA/Hda family protein, partial [Hyphomicrobiales bacterium]|nr:DnaA/Hda family protein [Hyphomicrobiales bacterium]
IISASNIKAFNYLKKWPQWDDNFIALIGKQGSGKSHLAKIWALENNSFYLDKNDTDINEVIKKIKLCVVVEDLDRIDYNSTFMFHLINHVKEINGYILYTSRRNPASLKLNLQDLDSRLRAAIPIRIEDPDDFLLEAILIKLFADKQIDLSANLTNFILKRSNRSCEYIKRLVDSVYIKIMEERRPLTIPLLSNVLEEMEEK